MNITNGVLIFDIYGPIAHFRKYYTNSSSLSYAFPPRTVITGILAGLLGWERDSYYEIFSPKCCSVAVKLQSRLRKIFQTVNYLFIKNLSDLNGRSGHTQIPIELVVPALREKEIRYRIYFAHQEKEIMKELANILVNKKYYYPPYLGLSEFIASIELVATKGIAIKEIPPGETVELCTPVNTNLLEKDGVLFEVPNSQVILQYLKERMPLSFLPGRKPGGVADFIFEKNQHFIRAQLNSPAWKLKYLDAEETIVFMEGKNNNAK